MATKQNSGAEPRDNVLAAVVAVALFIGLLATFAGSGVGYRGAWSEVTHIQRRLTGGKVGGSAFKHGGGRRGVPPATAVISDDMLRRGIASRGNEVRARRLIQQLLDGKGASVAVVGGSISEGHVAQPFNRSYAPLVSEWLRKTYPNGNHTFRNGAIAGSGSGYMSLCVGNHVPEDADLVLVEYDVNDALVAVQYGSSSGPTFVHLKDDWVFRAYERLVRRLLNLPKKPLVIHVATFPYAFQRFWFTQEDNHAIISSMYGMPRLSLRLATYESWKRDIVGWGLDDFMGDGLHPNNKGHQALTDLVTGYLASVEEGLAERPLTVEEGEYLQEPLLPPLIEGNLEHTVQNCLESDQFREVGEQGSKSGFVWKEEGKGKWGFIATEVDAFIRFTVDTTAVATTANSGQIAAVVVMFTFLASYEHMGQAIISCVSGCVCHPTVFNGHWDQHSSQLSRHDLVTTEHAQCELEVRVLPQTTSGEHKVKLAGLIVSDETWVPTAVHQGIDPTRFMNYKRHNGSDGGPDIPA